jgi:mRNA interferase RelE/StbE
MASYEIEITATAEKQLRRLTRSDQQRVAKAVIALAGDPRPRGARKLTGWDDVYRIRVGRFRVLYSVTRKRLVILILKIGHRREAYR